MDKQISPLMYKFLSRKLIKIIQKKATWSLIFFSQHVLDIKDRGFYTAFDEEEVLINMITDN